MSVKLSEHGVLTIAVQLYLTLHNVIIFRSLLVYLR